MFWICLTNPFNLNHVLLQKTFLCFVYYYGVILKQLKRRLSNTRPVKKRQGPCPKKRTISNVKAEKVEELEVEPKKDDNTLSGLSNGKYMQSS